MPLRNLALVLSLLAGSEQAVWAGVGTSTLTAQTSVAANCTFFATSAISFGNYNPVATNLTSDLNAQGSITFKCVKGTPAVLSLNFGTHASSGQRRLFDSTASDFLNYDIYQPQSTTPGASCTFAGSIKWGDGTFGTATFNPTAPDKTNQTYNICGVIPMAQNPSIGTSYSDTVVITVSF